MRLPAGFWRSCAPDLFVALQKSGKEDQTREEGGPSQEDHRQTEGGRRQQGGRGDRHDEAGQGRDVFRTRRGLCNKRESETKIRAIREDGYSLAQAAVLS